MGNKKTGTSDGMTYDIAVRAVSKSGKKLLASVDDNSRAKYSFILTYISAEMLVNNKLFLAALEQWLKSQSAVLQNKNAAAERLLEEVNLNLSVVVD